MIFTDANYFLRYVVTPTTPQDQVRHDIAAALFAAVERGEVEVTTSEAVLAEVLFVLTSKRQYGIAPADSVAYLKPILSLAHFRLPPGHKGRWLRAMDLFASTPNLGFVDALTAIYAQQQNLVLATFDGDFDAIPGITRYVPPSEE